MHARTMMKITPEPVTKQGTREMKKTDRRAKKSNDAY
jgi:hypothetical protein